MSAIAIATAGMGFIDFGTNSHWVREISRGLMDPDELGRRLTSKIICTLAIGIIWAAITSFVAPGSGLWTASPVMLGLMVNQTSQVALRAAKRGDLVSITIVADKLVAFLAFLALWASGSPSPEALWISLTCGSFTASILGWMLVERRHRPVIRIGSGSNPWRGAGYYGVSSLANSAQTLDLPVLSIVAGPAAAGLFAAVNRWTQPMSLLASAFSAASAPFVSRSADVVEAWRHVRQAAWMPLCAIGLSAGVALAAPILVPVLLGNGYLGSVDNLRILALVAIFSIMSQPLTVVLQSLGHDRFVGTWMGIAVLTQLALVVVLGFWFGSLGAAYASLAIQILLFGALVARVSREYRDVRLAGVLAEIEGLLKS
ncbi:lipopolysaccharide biosynthesis protein [Sinomonas sp.]|uniref:lipopolysaccharide biosynthesis protein n=1 Tax=Sinomonas sp. TaxID=1914986 RepID=UPI002FE24CC4